MIRQPRCNKAKNRGDIKASPTENIHTHSTRSNATGEPPNVVAAAPPLPLGKYLTAAMQRASEPLLHQQCWCWGQDIRHEECNLLLAYGFTKHRPPETEDGISAYALDLATDAERSRSLVLWGFGLFFGDRRHGGIFLGRCKFTPKLTEEYTVPLPLWKVAQLPALDIPRTRENRWRALALLHDAARWIESYERWVTETTGSDYRARCIARFKHATHTPEEAVTGWRFIGDTCAELLKGSGVQA